MSVILLIPTLLFTIGWFNRSFLINELQDWYNENNNGNLEIGKVDATFIKGFPNVGFTIRDIRQTGYDSILDKRSEIYIKKARVSIAAIDLIKGNIQFRNIEIDDASIYTEVITTKSRERYIQVKQEKQDDIKRGLQLPGWLYQERTNFRLNNIKFIARDTMLHTYFDIELHQAQGRIRSNREDIRGKLTFTATVHDLGFNTKKGSYLNGALLRGEPEFILDKNVNVLKIEQFPLGIGEQIFETGAEFDFSGLNSYKFSLQNEHTDFQQLKGLLPERLSSKLELFHIDHPFPTSLNLRGNFRFGDVPYIDGTFTTEENSLRIADSIMISDVNFNGSLTNSLNLQPGLENEIPSKKDIRIFFKDIQGSFEDIKINLTDSYYQSTNEALNFVNASLIMNGTNATLARLMQTNNFDFIGGNFKLDTQIHGNIENAGEIFDHATGIFTLRDTRVVLQKNNLQLPVQDLRVKLNAESSILENLKINLPNGDHLTFQGNITNISSLLVDQPKKPSSADVSLHTENLDINALIDTAMEFIPESEKAANSKTLHETFDAIYKKFQPRFRLDLQKVSYDSIQFRDLKADMVLKNSETVSLDRLSFSYLEAETILHGNLKIPKPENNYLEPLYLNVFARSSGPIHVFEKLFNIELLEIKEGEYKFSGNIAGNIRKIEQVLNKANGDLKFTNAKFYYPDADLDIQLDSLRVRLHEANIKLDKFVIEAGDHNPFSLSGQITEFPGFLLDNIKSNGKIYLNLDAELVDLNEWLETIRAMEKDSTTKTLKNRELAVILADIYQFDPEFSLKIDSLKFGDLVSEDISARVFFENDSVLRLKDLTIHYKDSKAAIEGMLAAHYLERTDNDNPFNFEFSAEASGRSRDLNDLLQTVNFDLRSGSFNFRGSYAGQASDLKIMNTNAFGELLLGKTMVDIKGTQIQVPIDSLHLYIENNLATLKRLDVQLPGKSSIDITGEIDNFSGFINNDDRLAGHTSSFSIHSAYLDNRDIKEFIGSGEKIKDSAAAKDFQINDLKKVLSNLNNSYFPSAEIRIDSLIYDNIAVSRFNANIGFNDSGDISIDKTGFRYYNGSAEMILEAGLNTENDLPVKIQMEIKDLAVKKLVEDLNHFNNKELQEAKKIGGLLDLKFDLSGTLNEKGMIEFGSLNGSVDVFIKDLALYDYTPLMESVVLLKEERFEDLRFRPIRQTFQVINGKVLVPRTQIQSTALQVFVEGAFQPGESYDLWISIPWSNLLKRRDGEELPQKISFDNSGAKFYLQITQDKESEKERDHKLKTKFRLGNRKLKKEKPKQEDH